MINGLSASCRALALATSFALPGALLATHANATTITFDALPDEGTALSDPNGGTVYKENGITVNALSGVAAWWTNPGYAHLDDAGTGFTSALEFNEGGGTFDALGFSLLSLGYLDLDPFLPPVTDNILVSGFSGAALVASTTFTLTDILFATQDLALDSSFQGLTSLVIELAYPSGQWCAPCGHFDLDSVTLANVAPVPLPAPALLMGAGIAALGGIRLSRKVRARRV